MFQIAPRMAAEFVVMHLQALHASASLASPAVALQYVAMQLAMAVRIEPKSRAFSADLLHETFWLT